MEFRMESRPDGQIAITTLTGRIDGLNSRQLRQHFTNLHKTTNRFVFDCKKLDFIDSSGLGTVVECLRKALSSGGDLRLAGLGPKAMMIFELTQVHKLFAIFADVDQALASFEEQHT